MAESLHKLGRSWIQLSPMTLILHKPSGIAHSQPVISSSSFIKGIFKRIQIHQVLFSPRLYKMKIFLIAIFMILLVGGALCNQVNSFQSFETIKLPDVEDEIPKIEPKRWTLF